MRNASGGYSQTYLGEFPTIPNPSNGNAPFIFGAEADFFPLSGIADFGNGVLNLDALTTRSVIGYIYGGIVAEKPNRGDSAASNFVFEVTYTPVATPSVIPTPVRPPSFRYFGDRSRKTGSPSRLVKGVAENATAIEWRVNGGNFRDQPVRANGKWNINVRPLRPGKNRIYLRATNAGRGQSRTQKLIIQRN